MRHQVLVSVLSLLLVALVLSPAAASGPIPGCRPAEHVTFKGPWDGGPWYFPKWSDKELRPLKLAIVHTWANLNAPSIKDHPRNPGQPHWSNRLVVQTKITPKILRKLGGKMTRLYALGGEAWIYKNNRACRHNIKFEFRNGNLPIRTLARLADEGLAYIW